MEVSGQLHFPAALPRYQFDMRHDGNQAGLNAVEKRKNVALTGIELVSSGKYPIAIPIELSRILKWKCSSKHVSSNAYIKVYKSM
jgi:hypothetical protein